jgi:hypothetical protein
MSNIKNLKTNDYIELLYCNALMHIFNFKHNDH